MNALILALFAALSMSGPLRVQHEPAIPQLSTEGRAAYEQVASATMFGIGPVGIAGTTSDAEKAVRTLLVERNGAEALARLAESATPVGRLYGLAGLSALDKARAAALARKVARESGETEVQQISGCIVSPVRVADVCARIERGEYREQLARPARTL